MMRSLTSLVLFCLAALAFTPHAGAASLKSFDWRLGQAYQTFQVQLDAPCSPRLKNEASARHYFYLDYFGLDGPQDDAEWDVKGSGVYHVRRVYYAKQRVLRLVFYTRGDVHVALGGTQTSQLVQVAPINYRAVGQGRPGAVKKRIVIDPGHGGDHMGAETSRKIGGRTYYEEEITIKIAFQLAALINRTTNMEAVLTRTDNSYVSLPRRVEIAEQAQGDLFVSIHLNATDSRRKTARGFEIYYLSDGTKAINKHLLELENEIDMDSRASSREDIREILKSLAGDKLAERQAQSSQLAQVIGEEFQNYGISRDEYRGVKSMPFRVLIQYSMPAVLAECFFLDNPYEASQLVQPQIQQQIAVLLFNGINRYVALSDPRFMPQLADRSIGKDAASSGRP
ncbi:N-acetylmuramoyl-L-alanine amidase [bacterium]|nr:N-acetylmuramoyl-L-alanine amidase [bacterium]